jgi:hypothetical protein
LASGGWPGGGGGAEAGRTKAEQAKAGRAMARQKRAWRLRTVPAPPSLKFKPHKELKLLFPLLTSWAEGESG